MDNLIHHLHNHLTNIELFNVSEPYTEILGGPDIYLEEGFTMNLTCLVKDRYCDLIGRPQLMFWSVAALSHLSTYSGTMTRSPSPTPPWGAASVRSPRRDPSPPPISSSRRQGCRTQENTPAKPVLAISVMSQFMSSKVCITFLRTILLDSCERLPCHYLIKSKMKYFSRFYQSNILQRISSELPNLQII